MTNLHISKSSFYDPLTKTTASWFVTTWGWINNDRLVMFGWAVPLRIKNVIYLRLLHDRVFFQSVIKVNKSHDSSVAKHRHCNALIIWWLSQTLRKHAISLIINFWQVNTVCHTTAQKHVHPVEYAQRWRMSSMQFTISVELHSRLIACQYPYYMLYKLQWICYCKMMTMRLIKLVRY